MILKFQAGTDPNRIQTIISYLAGKGILQVKEEHFRDLKNNPNLANLPKDRRGWIQYKADNYIVTSEGRAYGNGVTTTGTEDWVCLSETEYKKLDLADFQKLVGPVQIITTHDIVKSTESIRPDYLGVTNG